MFKKILVANRGEIAVRIIRTCKKMNIKTVAVFSEIDSRSLHVQEADESFLLGPDRSRDSYLVKEKIIDLALKQGCQAIHPGYGFLSENAEFAGMVAEAGLVFIGPPAAAIALLGDKIASKKLAVSVGLPVAAGSGFSLESPEEAVTLAEEIGLPIMIKPAAGGGGKGMRVVEKMEALVHAISLCQEEALKAFGDGRIFIERYLPNPRHVEIQIMADPFGNAVYLGERECSIQRRHQKIIEESPSCALTEARRREMGELACALARAAGFSNVGTVEFMLDQQGDFYFLEINTRLQVEHPVTEMVTSLDLVEFQLLIASGMPLSLKQDEIVQKGWAIEARICAENPSCGFIPDTGIITRYALPKGKNIRVDSGIEAGSFISIYYDSLLAKVIAWGENREEAREDLIQALNGYHIEGVITNVDFANAILNHPTFIQGKLSTDFIPEHFGEGKIQPPPEPKTLHYMVIASTLVYHNRNSLVRDSLKPMSTHVGLALPPKNVFNYMVKGGDDVFDLRLSKKPNPGEWTVSVNNEKYQVKTPAFEFYRRRLRLNIDDQSPMFRLQYEGNFIWTAFRGVARTFEIYSPKEWRLSKYMPEPGDAAVENYLPCPMPGLVVAILVSKGDRVYRGQDLVSIESMKMESFVASPCDGLVHEVLVKPGQAVETGDTLLTFNGLEK